MKFAKSLTQGICWKVFSCFCFAIGNIFVRYLTGGNSFCSISPEQLAWLKDLVGCSIILPQVTFRKLHTLKTKYPILHALRIIFAALGGILFYSSLKVMPVAESVALQFTTPILTTILCSLFLKERMTLYRLVSIAVALVGVLMIQHTDGKKPSWEYESKMFLSCGSALCFIIAKISGKYLLNRGETPYLLTTYLVLGMALAQLVSGTCNWVWPSVHQWVCIVALGIVSWMAHYAMSKSYCYRDIIFLMPFSFSRLLFSAFFSYLIFQEFSSSIGFWMGSCFLFASSYIVTCEEVQTKKHVPQNR